MIDLDNIAFMALEILKSNKRDIDETIEELENDAGVYSLYKYADISFDENLEVMFRQINAARIRRKEVETDIKKLENLIESFNNPMIRADIEEALKKI